MIFEYERNFKCISKREKCNLMWIRVQLLVVRKNNNEKLENN